VKLKYTSVSAKDGSWRYLESKVTFRLLIELNGTLLTQETSPIAEEDILNA